MGMLLMMVVASVTAFAAVAIAVMLRQPAVPELATRAPMPPSWTLQLPPGLPAAPVDQLFTEGIEALREGETRKALESFYRALQADPGNPSAERLSFAAGEFMVMDALETEMKAAADARVAYEQDRDDLLERAEYRGRRGFLARKELTERFGDDPVVLDTLNWRTPEAVEARQARAAEAVKLANEEKWAEAYAAYQEVLAEAKDPVLKDRARAGIKSARRELARLVATRWQQAVAAEAQGSLDSARSLYRQILEVDPANPSARLRLERLGGELPTATTGG
jgi:tetratricopeptide (TPR) repeat protein